ncbi:MAG: SIS domain-containing protein [Tenericutes bacterium]|nr:SIS domain-containing protein [Mycoplasmatota bacterium]
MSAKLYYNEISKLIEKIEATQYDTMLKVANIFAKKVKEDKLIHFFGTGHSHMIGIEMFVRAGGLANVNAMLDETITTAAGAEKGSYMEKVDGLADIIYNQYAIDKDDVMVIISNSGRNSVPVQMAMRAKKEGLTVIAITSYDHSKSCASRDKSDKKLFELADIVLDNCCPAGDALINFGEVKSGPGSTIAGCFIVDSILEETLDILHKKNYPLPIFVSQNSDNFNNDHLYEKYRPRVKHM